MTGYALTTIVPVAVRASSASSATDQTWKNNEQIYDTCRMITESLLPSAAPLREFSSCFNGARETLLYQVARRQSCSLSGSIAVDKNNPESRKQKQPWE